jgi:hypothetical protein
VRVRLPPDLIANERQNCVMPVDLSPAGLPSVYPAHGPRFWSWLSIGCVCNMLGAPLVIALWPAGSPTHGLEFWGYVLGIPNLLFAVVLGLHRSAYEVFWFRAHYRNQFRDKWLQDQLRVAQRPLKVLAIGYSLPIGNQTLAAVIADGKALPKPQAPRKGSGIVVHARFAETNSPIDDPSDISSLEVDANVDVDVQAGPPPVSRKSVTPLALKIAKALEPLAASLHALTLYESAYWPQVRVLAAVGDATLLETQVCDALRIAGLSELACHAIPSTDGLLVADAWLDAQERRPLLVVATAWHDANPSVGSTEGCVAILLDPGFYRLPVSVPVIGTLHRPVAGQRAALGDLFGNAVIWGKVTGPDIRRAWITRLTTKEDNALLAALREASLSGVGGQEAHRHPDRIVGDAGAVNGWLSIAAAIESAEEGPHLIIDRDQAAVLHVFSHAAHD